MKKTVNVVRVETIAFDNQLVHVQGPDVTAHIHFHDAKEHHAFSVGDEIELVIGDESAVAPKKAKAAKKAKA